MKKGLVWILILILMISLIGLVWVLGFSSKSKKTSQQKEETVPLDYNEQLKKIEELKHPGEPIQINEPGFGREDPFAPY